MRNWFRQCFEYETDTLIQKRKIIFQRHKSMHLEID